MKCFKQLQYYVIYCSTFSKAETRATECSQLSLKLKISGSHNLEPQTTPQKETFFLFNYSQYTHKHSFFNRLEGVKVLKGDSSTGQI